MLDTKALAEATATIVKAHVDAAVKAAVEPLLRRIDELERRAPERGEPGQPGRDGIDGKDGAAGRDGVDGAPGLAGKDADPITAEQIADAVSRYLESNPPAAGKDGSDGRDGKDGVSLAAGVIDREHNLILTLSNGEQKNLGRVVGHDGAPGKDGAPGRDGFSLKDFDTEMLPDGQTILLKFGSGDILEIHELFFPVVVDRGVWREGEAYTRGSGVTWGGSFWIAQRDNPGKPDTADGGWRLAVKKGQNGKDAKNG